MVRLLNSRWHEDLAALVGSARSRLLIVAPFISPQGAELVACSLNAGFRRNGTIEIITDLSPAHIADSSLSVEAVASLAGMAGRSGVWHIPRLHAKVYVADDRGAIVTSGNITAGAFYRNAEYGVGITDRTLVRRVCDDFDDYRVTGVKLHLDQLLQYAKATSRLVSAQAKERRAVDPRLTRLTRELLAEAQDELIRIRLEGGAVHTVFAKTIEYLLTKYGPMATDSIHEQVRRLHPDLCDDTVDRVIDCKHFGRKWKHAVRSAQQQLKRRGIAVYANGKWALVS